ncbi:SHS1 [Brettanomyces bruxellensis]|uniref:DEBR0S2_04610g1_1 n=1 Tax=Dekkera bruxellensis TaxID=5007 RepID=A0A7D9GYU6_DEKBR|nr:SHS1 [Brettanomyces bruxellensis]
MAFRVSPSLLKRQRELKRGTRFTLMVCGPSGTGKTSFVNSLVDKNILAHRYQASGTKSGKKADEDLTIPKTVTFSNISGVIENAAETRRAFDPQTANKEPGIAITETEVEIVDDDDSKLFLKVVDTPGFGENLDNTLCVNEICNYLEQQFDMVLAEETKVRRNPRFQDTRVHACLYFLPPTGHGLRELDVLAMKRMAKYVNVIPVVSRADSFTKTELINFKRRINEDIERMHIPVFQFSCDEDEDEPEIVEEAHFLQHLQPFAIVTSDEVATLKNGTRTRVRSYPWGQVDINDPDLSDFAILRSTVLGSHLQDLKDITHDFLYENYRTERLSAVSGLKGDFPRDTTAASLAASTADAPSMSNLAAIANSRSMRQFGGAGGEKEQEGAERDQEGAEREQDGAEKDADGADGETPNHENSSSMLYPESSTAKMPDLLRMKTSSGYSLGDDQELKSMTTDEDSDAGGNAGAKSPSVGSSGAGSGTSAAETSKESMVVDTRRLRKISETVPYMLRHQNLLTKQQKLEELERRSALSLAKRAAELEKKAMQLKLKEKRLKERIASRGTVAESSSSASVRTASSG